MEKKLWLSSKLLLLLCLCAFMQPAHAQVQASDFGLLDQVQGYWLMKAKHSSFSENWHRVNADCLQGVTWQITGKDSVKMDEMQLLRINNDIYYVVLTLKDDKGQPVRFKVRTLKPIGFVAENPAADYPQKVLYRFRGPQLDVHYEGKKEGTFSEIILQYER